MDEPNCESRSIISVGVHGLKQCLGLLTCHLTGGGVHDIHMDVMPFHSFYFRNARKNPP